MKQLATTLIYLASTLPALAGLSGNQLLEICRRSSPEDVSFCQGFILGSVNMGSDVQHYGDSRFIGSGIVSACVPPEATLDQLVDLALGHLEDTPETRHYSAASTIWLAMSRAFPCDS
ncbi:Rap1a/Tai family immunity protein [Aliiroseovarius sp. YM-037]|uniref:Rap1a/Tai family immunity protein n=1 Tax=Aliiroseovarius sp. YM-037 TaxID=3341728 RepID=UPI003A7F6A09